MTGLTMMTIGLVLFAIIGIVLSFYLMYWLIIELPVLVRIKHNELYNKFGIISKIFGDKDRFNI